MAISTREITNELWRRGNLDFLLKPKQKELKRFLASKPHSRMVANAHRQFGKSTAMFALCCEFAIKNPRTITKFGAPTSKQVKEIIRVVKDTVLVSCPPDMMPEYKKADGEFVFPNGSIIKMIGVDIDDGDRLRGTPADFVILDEAGFMNNLENLVDSVIEPQFIQRPGGRLVMISTPSTAVAHDYTRIFIPRARSSDTYWELKITENPQFSADYLQTIIDKYATIDMNGEIVMSGMKNERFRREYLCEIFTATELQIIPEWQHFKQGLEHGLVRSMSRPEHFRLVVSMDFGWSDRTGVLFGWVDYENGLLFIQDELFVNYKTPTEVAEMIMEKLERIVPQGIDNLAVEPLFTCDLRPDQMNEMRKQSNLPFKYAKKHDKEASITSLRQKITTSRIVVNPECKDLILQLDTGTWKNAERTVWDRTDHMGHLDLIDALIYMNRVVPWNTDFTPATVVDTRHMFQPLASKKPNNFAKLLGR